MDGATSTLIIVVIVSVLVPVLTFTALFHKPLFEHDRQAGDPWQQCWGESYGPELKRQLLEPVFERLDKEEKLGSLVVDVGCWASPVTQLLKAKPGRKRVCVDIAADNCGSSDELKIQLDAGKVGQFGALSFWKAMLRVCAFLERASKTIVSFMHS